MCQNQQFPADLVTFTEEIHNEKVYFLRRKVCEHRLISEISEQDHAEAVVRRCSSE